jgi:membrane protein implicated in regulation of membrane protease activity
MDGWLLWLIAAIVFGVGEILTTGLVLAPFALGAVLAAVVAALGGSDLIGLVVFLAVAIAALTALRPIARRHLRQPPRLRTGTAALVGRNATVIDRIANDDDVGSVRLDGETWRARAYDDDEVFEPGARVQVLEIRGVTAVVAE